GKITWHYQYTPNDNHDYDEIGSHILIDTKVNGEDRRIIAHGPQRLQLRARPPQRPIPQGRPDRQGADLDEGPRSEDRQADRLGSEPRRPVLCRGRSVGSRQNTHRICPSVTGGTNFWPSSYSRNTGYLYIPAAEGCGQVSVDVSAHVKGRFGGG